MPTREATARWEGSIQEGKGTLTSGTGALDHAYSFGSRFESDKGTNPEELIGAAHAGCFSMALSKMLGDAGFPPESIETKARVQLEVKDDGPAITGIALETQASVPEIEEARFQEIADQAKEGCPVSQILDSSLIALRARLV
jgi:osmotically inducible protein OsmC